MIFSRTHYVIALILIGSMIVFAVGCSHKEERSALAGIKFPSVEQRLNEFLTVSNTDITYDLYFREGVGSQGDIDRIAREVAEKSVFLSGDLTTSEFEVVKFTQYDRKRHTSLVKRIEKALTSEENLFLPGPERRLLVEGDLIVWIYWHFPVEINNTPLRTLAIVSRGGTLKYEPIWYFSHILPYARGFYDN